MAAIAQSDACITLELETGEQRAGQSISSKIYKILFTFVLGTMVVTIGMISVQHYGLCDAWFMRFFFVPAVPRVQPMSGAIGTSVGVPLSAPPRTDSVGMRSPSQQTRLKAEMAVSVLPKLIVFDLDNTVWTPELYTLRKLQRAKITPRAGEDVELMEGFVKVWHEHIPKLQEQGVLFAVASRTSSVEWAHSLLGQFGLKEMMCCVEIFPAPKTQHFHNIKKATGISFDEMLFFDDALDGKYGNCEPVSELGVLSVHCPKGINDEKVFTSALDKYKEWDRSPNHIIAWDGSLTNTFARSMGRLNGVVKLIKHEKRYGFISYNDGVTRDIFFHFNSLPGMCTLEEGDEVSFEVQRDPANGKSRAAKIASTKPKGENTVLMKCFSMSQPFAALLANGYKTLETRNGAMFTQFPKGTHMLLHVGGSIYPDGDKHVEVMKSGGLNDEEIADLKKLKPGYFRGHAVAIVELGRTYETTVAERSGPDFQRAVAAYGADSGRMVTEISRVAYLKKPVKLKGQPGVFNVQIDPEVVPDGWRESCNEPSTEDNVVFEFEV